MRAHQKMKSRRLQTIPEFNSYQPNCSLIRCIFCAIVTCVLILFILSDLQLAKLSTNRPKFTNITREHIVCSRNLSELLSKPPKLQGKIKKQGVLPLHLWWNVSNQMFMHNISKSLIERNLSFLNGNVVQNGHLTTKFFHLPMAGPCGIYINHYYKFIFIKNTKIAGTSILQYFGWQCATTKDVQGGKTCFTQPDMESIPTSQAAKNIWQNYFVFAITRNPIGRGASIYNYLLGRRLDEGTQNKDGCKQPSFKKFCFAPYIIGLQTRKNNCLKNHQHDFYHAQNQVDCLKTEEGLPAVDFILSLENLKSDFKDLLNEIQSRTIVKNKDTNFFDDKGDLKQLQIGPQTGDYANEMFRQCGHSCLQGLAHSYKPDFQFFGYLNCATQLL